MANEEMKLYRIVCRASKTSMNCGGYIGADNVYGAVSEFLKANEKRLRESDLSEITISCFSISPEELKERILAKTLKKSQ